MPALRRQFHEQGFVLLRSFFPRQDVFAVRAEARSVFVRQMLHRGIVEASDVSEAAFEAGMARFFVEQQAAFFNCGKACQHLVSLHRLSLAESLIQQLHELGVEAPVICTRPVLSFHARALAKAEVHYRTPPHQDWRSMQGSLNAVVVWVPLLDVDRALGALEIIPRSHLDGLHDSEPDAWYRHIPGTGESDFVSVEVSAGDALFFSAFLIHRSGNNTTDAIRWSCHFRYNDLAEPTFLARGYPCPYVYKPQQELITPNFPEPAVVRRFFAA
jgi:phytanoyl-CoA hydroxylase